MGGNNTGNEGAGKLIPLSRRLGQLVHLIPIFDHSFRGRIELIISSDER